MWHMVVSDGGLTLQNPKSIFLPDWAVGGYSVWYLPGAELQSEFENGMYATPTWECLL